MSKPPLNIGIVGHNFMGRAHSNAWRQAAPFFDLPMEPVLKAACGRDAGSTRAFADNWGWESVETDWEQLVAREDIDVVDISVPTALHRDIAVAAAARGKHLFCEKPFCRSVAEAAEMHAAAEAAGVVHYINHNYRRTPAVRLARKLIEAGKIGRIFHWRGAYQQDWLVDPSAPLGWQLREEEAGAGPQLDLNSHSVDLARYLVGEIATVSCLTASFIKERPLPAGGASAFRHDPSAGDGGEMGEVTVEDAALMMVEFENGAVGSFEGTRFAPGRKNHNTFEIYGSEGSLTFDLERMNEIQFFSRDDPGGEQGFRTIQATDPSHDFVSHWWPPGHIIGYEHAFTHAVADFVHAVHAGGAIDPDFADGIKTMAVLEAGLRSASSGAREPVAV